MKPGKHQRSKQRCQDLCCKVHNLLFCVHTQCMSYIIKTFLLVSSSVSSKQLLCFVHRQGQKREQKHTTKNFVEFHNHSPLLTMVKTMSSNPHPDNTGHQFPELIFFPLFRNFPSFKTRSFKSLQNEIKSRQIGIRSKT